MENPNYAPRHSAMVAWQKQSRQDAMSAAIGGALVLLLFLTIFTIVWASSTPAYDLTCYDEAGQVTEGDWKECRRN